MIKKRLKIALLSTPRVAVPPPKYGGTELIVYNLAEGLVKKGHKVTVFATGDSHTSAELEYVCKQSGYSRGLPKSSAESLLHCSHSFAKIKNGSFDIVHNHYGIWGLAFGKLLNIPVVSTYHGDFSTDFNKSDIKFFERLASGFNNFVSISRSQVKNTPFKLNWVANVYNGIEVDKFMFNDQPKNYFVWLGRFSAGKGAKEAILAARRLKVKLILAGRLSKFHQDEVEYFNNEVKPLIDGESVKYVGEINHQEKVTLLKDARALLNLISWNEPFGLVMTEAMACGTPVIANRRGSVPEVVADEETGFITNSQSDIIKAIKNIDQIDRYKCRKRVEKYFSAEKMIDEYEKVYYKLLNKKTVCRKKK